MRKKLKDVCMFYSGTGFPIQYQGQTKGEYPFYKVGDIANNAIAGKIYLELCNNYISSDVAKMIKGCILPKDTVVFAKIGEALKLNRRAITSCDCLIDNNAMGIAPKLDSLRIQYFYFCMKNLKMQTLAESTTVPSVRKTVLEKYEIEVPSLVEQEEIEKKLTLTQKIIEKRRQELSYLDEIIKARFVELFGDPDNNEKSWDIDKMEHLCEVGSSKRIYQNEQSMEGVPFLRISDLVNRIDTGSKKCDLYIPIEKLAELKEQGLVPRPGDILLTARGTLGRCYIVQSDDEFYFQDGMITWLSNYDRRITALYISYLFEMPGFRKQIDELQAGATVAYMSISMTKKLNIMVPPIELQNQFADFVKQVDKSKFDTMTFAPIYAIINLYLHTYFYQGRR